MAISGILRIAAPLDGPRPIPRRDSARRGVARASPGSRHVFDRSALPFVLVAALLLTANILMATWLHGRGDEATLFPTLGAAGMPMALWWPQYCPSAGAISAPRLVRADLASLLDGK